MAPQWPQGLNATSKRLSRGSGRGGPPGDGRSGVFTLSGARSQCWLPTELGQAGMLTVQAANTRCQSLSSPPASPHWSSALLLSWANGRLFL